MNGLKTLLGVSFLAVAFSHYHDAYQLIIHWQFRYGTNHKTVALCLILGSLLAASGLLLLIPPKRKRIRP